MKIQKKILKKFTDPQKIQIIHKPMCFDEDTDLNTASTSLTDHRMAKTSESEYSDTVSQEGPINQHYMDEYANDHKLLQSLENILHEAQIKGKILLKLVCESQNEYILDQTDIELLMARFGQVDKIDLAPDGLSALVSFVNPVHALFVSKYLNNFKISQGLEISVFIIGVEQQNQQQQTAIQLQYSQMYHQPINYCPTQQSQQQMYQYQNQYQDGYNNNYNNNGNNGYQTKFTSRYEIQIKNEKRFNVSQRIIGSKGVNMKNILLVCERKFKHLHQKGGNLIKLRLRGKGSGFKEGPNKRESQEPLHLCVSSKYRQVYDRACSCIEELILQIYKEYFAYCEKRVMPYNATLSLKKLNGHGKYPTDGKRTFAKKDSYNPSYRYQPSFTQQLGMQWNPQNFQWNNNDNTNNTNNTNIMGYGNFFRPQNNQFNMFNNTGFNNNQHHQDNNAQTNQQGYFYPSQITYQYQL